MRIIDCMPPESSVFFTPEKKDFIHLKFPRKPIGIRSPLLVPYLNLKEYLGLLRDNNYKLYFFIATAPKMV
jgi:hypothetical protein